MTGPPRSGLRIGSIVLRVDELDRQIAFWTAALGYEVARRVDDFAILRPPARSTGPNLSLDAVPAGSRSRRRSTSTCTPRTRPARSSA